MECTQNNINSLCNTCSGMSERGTEEYWHGTTKISGINLAKNYIKLAMFYGPKCHKVDDTS